MSCHVMSCNVLIYVFMYVCTYVRTFVRMLVGWLAGWLSTSWDPKMRSKRGGRDSQQFLDVPFFGVERSFQNGVLKIAGVSRKRGCLFIHNYFRCVQLGMTMVFLKSFTFLVKHKWVKPIQLFWQKKQVVVRSIDFD